MAAVATFVGVAVGSSPEQAQRETNQEGGDEGGKFHGDSSSRAGTEKV